MSYPRCHYRSVILSKSSLLPTGSVNLTHVHILSDIEKPRISSAYRQSWLYTDSFFLIYLWIAMPYWGRKVEWFLVAFTTVWNPVFSLWLAGCYSRLHSSVYTTIYLIAGITGRRDGFMPSSRPFIQSECNKLTWNLNLQNPFFCTDRHDTNCTFLVTEN